MSQDPSIGGFIGAAQRVRNRFVGAHEATVPFWPRWAIRQRADRRLREIVRVAAAQVPFYRDQVARGELDPTELRGIADLNHWPVVPADALREEPQRLVSERADRSRCIVMLSSGSTGGRKTIYLDPDAFIDNARYESRIRWMTYKLTGKLFGLRRVSIIVAGGPLDELGRRYAQLFQTPAGATQTARLTVGSTFDEKVAVINDVRPHIVGGVADAVADFFLEAHDRGVPVHRPLLISGTAEGIRPAVRQRLERDCGIPVRLRYTSVESPRIGFECEAGDGYHIDEDVCAVRIVGDDRQDLPEGETGRVVITNLVNRATVLINYDQGDRGRISRAPCRCGRRFQRLWLEGTRETPLLRTPSRRVIHYGEVLRPMLTQPGFDALQVIVEGPDRWRILVRTEDNTHHAWHDSIAEWVEGMTGNELKVEVSLNTLWEFSEAGKQLPVIIRCSDQPPYSGASSQ